MSFAKKLGKSYEMVRDQAKTKKITVELGEVKFSLNVRIPLKREMELLTEKVTNPNSEKVQEIYLKLTKSLKSSLDDGGEDFVKAINSEKETIKVTDDDIILDGTSMRQVATMTAVWESQVEEFFHLLISDNGEPITESFDEISEEFPEQVIKEIVTQIDQAIRPDYKTAKKN